jgi:hypothetical protein
MALVVTAFELEPITYAGPDGESRSCPMMDRFTMRVRVCKRRDCPRCGVPWALAWQTSSHVNLDAYHGPVALVTITAPGADVLPWSCAGAHQHSGTRGCRVKDDAADVWSAHCRENWQQLRDAARAACRRRGLKPTLLERVWEPQKRGVPHLHLVVGMGTLDEREAAQAFVEELHRLAADYMFGFVDRKLALVKPEEAARYLSSYLLGRSRKKGTIRENISDPRMPRSLVWITPALTTSTRVTMRTLRYARWYLAALNDRCDVWPVLRGELLLHVAKAAALVEALRAHAPPDESRHVANLQLMRRMAWAA